MSRNAPTVRVIVALIVLSCCHVLFGHQGDPKMLDRQKPYMGAGYRSGVPMAGGPSITFPSSGMQLLSWLTLNELHAGLDNGNDCWGYVSPAGREYAIIGTSHGTTFVEITNPGNPTITAWVDGPVSLWRDVKTYQHYCYAVSEGGDGIQVMDLDDIDNGNVTLVTSITDGGNADTHNVVINEASGFLYRAGGGDNGLRIYDLANPASPALVATWPDRYVHDAIVFSYTSGPYAGHEIAFCCAGFDGGWVEPGLDILDVTDKSNIQLLSRTTYPNAAYCHQGWPSTDMQYFYLNDELDEVDYGINTSTRILDISDLANPIYLGALASSSTSIDHNLYVREQTIFEANYRSGLHVFDASNPTAPTEIAYFDTYPDDDATNYNSLWSVYAYFPSGTIIGSDIEKGLFVWHLGEIPLVAEFPFGTPDLVAPVGGDSLRVDLVEQVGSLDPTSVMVHYDVGDGEVVEPMTSIGGMSFEFLFPAQPCRTDISYFITAQTTDGWQLVEPSPATGTPFEAIYTADDVPAPIDDMESPSGFTVGSPTDDATAGIWERVDPIGTPAQPEDDHTESGQLCWVTGQGTGGGVGEQDVDGGHTTLTSPVYDVTGADDAIVSYWRWYSNSQGTSTDDVFSVEIANLGGAWIVAETVDAASGQADGGWYFHRIRIGDLINPTLPFNVRFIAADEGLGSIVEAAVDDFQITRLYCDDCNSNGIDDVTEILEGSAEDCNGNGVPDSCDIDSGSSLDDNGDGIPDECQCDVFFVRGDTNGDLSVDVSDGVFALDYMFSGGPEPLPLEAADLNVDGSVNVADVVYLLNYLFAMGPPPSPPFPNPGCE